MVTGSELVSYAATEPAASAPVARAAASSPPRDTASARPISPNHLGHGHDGPSFGLGR
ncbi:hypothetical protein ACTXG6_33975 [Pseudonocardia sp. Cha107L01]|uniref:hypothetical protein n=1 Tax=Pseudonocardia sp. Cha107L01 TaxID=3457576 RepID=UPI00403E8CDE